MVLPIGRGECECARASPDADMGHAYDHDWHYQQRRGYGREEQDAVDVEVSKKPRFRRAAPYSRSERFIRAAWHHAWGGRAHAASAQWCGTGPLSRAVPWAACACMQLARGVVCVCMCVRVCVRACVRWSGGEGRRKVACMGPKQMLRRTRFAELKVCAQHRYHSVATKPSLRGTPRQAIARSWQPGAQRSWHARKWTHLRSQWRDSRRTPAGRALT